MAEKNISGAELINQETGGKFEALPEMTLTTRLILGECRLEIAEILKLRRVVSVISGRASNFPPVSWLISSAPEIFFSAIIFSGVDEPTKNSLYDQSFGRYEP
jgi:hypothetical protein